MPVCGQHVKWFCGVCRKVWGFGGGGGVGGALCRVVAGRLQQEKENDPLPVEMTAATAQFFVGSTK